MTSTRTVADGVQELLDQMKQQPSILDIPLEEARRRYIEAASSRTPSLAALECVVTDAIVEETGNAIRVYEPARVRLQTPVLYFHGGGFIVGGIESHAWLAGELAAHLGTAVVLVDYRLAPEHPHPIPLNDCLAAARWVTRNLGQSGGGIAVAGDSAGGNLAAAVAMAAQSEQPGLSVRAMLMAYPMLDAQMGSSSFEEFDSGWGLDTDHIRSFWATYLGDHPATPASSPSLAGSLAGLPSSLVVSAEFDVLRDEAEQFAARLAGSAVPTVFRRAHGLTHGFLDYAASPDVPAARLAMVELFDHFALVLRQCEARAGREGAHS